MDEAIGFFLTAGFAAFFIPAPLFIDVPVAGLAFAMVGLLVYADEHG
jgi:hypothetical protein